MEAWCVEKSTEELAFLKEQVAAQQAMLKQTVEHMQQVQNELVKAKDRLSTQHKEITDSIQYAEYIQKAIIPDEHILKDYFQDSFIAFLPKSIVSGDLPWIKTTNDYVYIAALDCTGHGVPGAMLSMLCYSIINNVTESNPDIYPDKIIEKTLAELRSALAINKNGIHDSVELSVVKYYPKSNVLFFASTGRPLIVVETNGNTFLRKGNKVLTTVTDESYNITLHIVCLQKDDWFYLSSDGFVDQIGEAMAKKYKIDKFISLLGSLAGDNGATQKLLITDEAKKWRGSVEQTDDILVIGLKV